MYILVSKVLTCLHGGVTLIRGVLKYGVPIRLQQIGFARAWDWARKPDSGDDGPGTDNRWLVSRIRYGVAPSMTLGS
jgi:hypothetical protein